MIPFGCVNMNYFRKFIRYLTDDNYRFDVNSSYGLCNGLEDEVYIKRQFKMVMGYDLPLDNPTTFNEKLQWLKLNDRKAEYTTMVDKYLAKQYVSGIIGDSYVIPTIGVWDSFDEIDFSKLPNAFVLKCTHDSGGVVVVRDKKTFDYSTIKGKMNKALKRNFYYYGREWPYKNVKPRIICENYMNDDSSSGFDDNIGLVDYKFFCFGGKAVFLYISKGLENHATAQISFYDLKGNEMPFHRKDYLPYHNAVLPGNFDEMIGIANVLAESIAAPFVRIDLYSINNKTYFSEITFSPCSGMLPFEPASADLELGRLIQLPDCK